MVWLALSALALADPVGWDDITDAALEAWSRGPGLATAARVQGAEQAARVMGASVALVSDSQLGAPGQQQSGLALALPLTTGSRARQLWQSAALAAEAEGAAAQFAYVADVHQAFLDWWVAHEIGDHLEAWSTEVEAGLAPVDEAVHAGVLAPLDAEDLRAELASVRSEAAEIQARVARAEAQLEVLLGGPIALETGGHRMHDLDIDSLHNPWSALAERAVEAPTVRASEARRDAARARAREASGWVPTVTAGPGLIEADGDLVPYAAVGLELPLRGSAPREARAARGEATAADVQTRWLRARAVAEFTAEQKAFDADLERARRLGAEVVSPLARRLERLEEAFAAGLVPADRLIRARRDHHEADHAHLEVVAGLLASQARAEATRLLLDGARP